MSIFLAKAQVEQLYSLIFYISYVHLYMFLSLMLLVH